MNTVKFFQKFSEQISESIPFAFKNLQIPIKEQINRGIEITVKKLNLISREEFEIQAALLSRLQGKVRKLEERVVVLENLEKKNNGTI